jgi:hypothetical protein
MKQYTLIFLVAIVGGGLGAVTKSGSVAKKSLNGSCDNCDTAAIDANFITLRAQKKNYYISKVLQVKY